MFRGDIKDDHENTFNLTTGVLTDAYNSKFMQDLRKSFRNGDKPYECSSCWDEEAAGRQSKRMSTFYRLRHIVDKIDWDNDTPDQLWFLDLKLGNVCNLKCKICGSWSSSKWVKEENNDFSHKMRKLGNWPRDNQQFWEDLRAVVPHVIYFEFTGGEPFLIEEHFKLLRFAVEQGYAHNIEIHYNTNGTIYPEEAFDLWKHFKTVEVAVSIDNLGKRFEYERYGAKWEEVEQNVKRFNEMRQSMPNLQTQVCLTVNVFNVYYLEELCSWVTAQHFNYDYFNMLHGEKCFCINSMTEEATKLVLSKLQEGKFSATHQVEVDRIVAFIKNGQPTDGKEFVLRTKRSDEYRKSNMLDTHFEIGKAMGYDNKNSD